MHLISIVKEGTNYAKTKLMREENISYIGLKFFFRFYIMDKDGV